ncbi:hypothetical protein FHR83_004225 [Actinoplanes campanulatus]|uniref:Uncharacterized protein n=1 Tax=Actinoplanes campanulatus TaxID=113559 RepID=A0A7W5AI51_9ACTN|nr:hypothetical protein [Actinoplanes campanulatus]MBB3096555.1 hypothetical protein [Actinoplanes campanulatus]GGN17431.1 hypothetical protein GCM10010109_30140 [Actinoplanes campanulatus]GID38622.1 hypothetical protein Aca09nite_51280 [Actinoplanes campanulatus]
MAAAALTAAGTPRDRDAVAAAIATLEVETPVGRLKWGAGPNRNVVSTPILGGQWVPGSGAYPLDFVLCENSSDPNVPVAGQLKRFGTLT